MMNMPEPSRGEVWLIELNPTRGHEQRGTRPALVVSVDEFNSSPSGLVVAVPITTKAKGVMLHVPVGPNEGGLRLRSFIKCDDIRSLARERLRERWGSVSFQTLAQVELRLRRLLGL
jgi:mRNA interferase MazF